MWRNDINKIGNICIQDLYTGFLKFIYRTKIYILENPVYKENNLYEGQFFQDFLFGIISNKFKF